MVGLIITLPGSISASALNKVRHVLLCCRKLWWRERWEAAAGGGVRRVGRTREEWKDCAISVGTATSEREQPEGTLLLWTLLSTMVSSNNACCSIPTRYYGKANICNQRNVSGFRRIHNTSIPGFSLHLIVRFVTAIFCIFLDIYRSVSNVGYALLQSSRLNGISK
jgi:hypothetical protein